MIRFNIYPFLSILLMFLMSCCNNQSGVNQLEQYFAYGDSIESAGVKMIPIHTPYGDFRVWTKRFGTNPDVKVLLLHGGPGLSTKEIDLYGGRNLME